MMSESHIRLAGIVNLRGVRESFVGRRSSQNAAEIPETLRQAAKARSRVARRSSAVAFSG
jgi:hypothetical protein